ncbi:MAG: tetratricopeptide repeat protein [Steroidobacteraceae bacterium]
MKTGRNDPCPCGSGKKYKKCCGQENAGPETAASLEPGDLAELIGSGRYAELEAKARKVVQQDPNGGLVWKALGVALRMQRKDALDALQKAALLLPGDAEAHSNLGNALLDLRRLNEAVASYRRALQIAPHFAEAHSNLGNALQGLGQFHEAVACYHRALQIKPQYPEAHNNLGNALRGLGRHDEAVAQYHLALQIKPQYAEAHSNLGNALRSLGQLDEAVAGYRRAIDITPLYAEAHNNLGNALLDLGRLLDAAESYRCAIEINPSFAGAHSNLSIALRRLGQFEQAEASCRRALALNPDFAGAHSNLGDVLRDLGKAEEAAACCRRAVQIDGNFAGGHNSLGNALLDLGRHEDAAASYRQALMSDPHFAASHINLGMVLRLGGRTAEAEASCRKALDLNAGAAASVLMAELHADNGRFAEAQELFRHAVALDPDSAEGWAGMAHLRKMTAGDSSWLAQAQRIADRRLAPRQEVYLRYAIGKYFDDVREFEQAFHNYRRANELTKLYSAGYDREEMPCSVDLLIRSYDKAWTLLPRPHAISSARPVFIAGMPRSGTTLAEQILASHPAVFGAGELTFWNNASATYQSSARNHEDGESLIGKLAADYQQLLAGLAPDALRVVDKMPANFLSLGLIHAAFPNARIIHLRRNPLDTCLSIYFQHFKASHAYANDLEDLSLYYLEYLRLMQHWRATLPEGTVLDVPYEGLVDEQEHWTRKMLAFVDLPWDARCLDFHRTNRSVVTASKWQVRQKISTTSVGRWRNYEAFLGPLHRLAQS